MVDRQTRQRVLNLLDAVDRDPTELPVAEVVGLAAEPVEVTVERRDGADVVFVSARPAACLDALSAREREVAELVAAGCSNHRIATELHISLGTVKDHVHAILAKTGLTNRAQVAAAMHGRTPDDDTG